ncbi:PQQ-dependent sugar dehydrogenase [Salinactinospora qingdaonensis]|uniref:CBM2 domain-containing protein n=1 Tax=Salinactinospora qingdaonensis TaxID=702744 RepID=A0ABP7GI83_9ACTN
MSLHRWAWRVSVAAAAAVLGLSTQFGAVANAASAAQVPLDDLEVTTTQVASGLDRPTAMVTPEDGSNRMLITEKPGTVRAYHADTGLSADPLLDISDRITSSGNEQGLLGIATASDFAQDPALYVAYTSAPDGTLTLSRFPMDSPSQSPVSAAGEEILLTQEHADYGNHNGGALAFGPEGYLYWSLGDGGGSGDPLDNGQDPSTLLGTIVRLDVSQTCGDNNYCVPPDNPFVSDPEARSEIWVYGLRNAWRFSFDSADDSLWIADVGQGSIEEVNHLAAGEAGTNFGWSCMEGSTVFDEERCASDADYTDPVFSYPHEDGACSVTGGYVYRGEEFTELADGTYVMTDYCNGAAWGVRAADDGTYTAARIGELPIQTTTFGVGPAGELYLANDLPGQLHRVEFEGPEPAAQCTVDYQVDSQWGTGFTASVTITNTSEEPVTGWSLEWSFTAGQQITNGWQAEVTQTGTMVTATNMSWNDTISPGGTQQFGFQGTLDGANPAPTEFTLNGSPCQ